MEFLSTPIDEMGENEQRLAIHISTRLEQLTTAMEVIDEKINSFDGIEKEKVEDVTENTATRVIITNIIENTEEDNQKEMTTAIGEQIYHLYEFYVELIDYLENDVLTIKQCAEKIHTIEKDIVWLPEITDSELKLI